MPYVIVRETLAEKGERIRKLRAARRRANNPDLPWVQRWLASQEMKRYTLPPPPPRLVRAESPADFPEGIVLTGDRHDR